MSERLTPAGRADARERVARLTSVYLETRAKRDQRGRFFGMDVNIDAIDRAAALAAIEEADR